MDAMRVLPITPTMMDEILPWFNPERGWVDGVSSDEFPPDSGFVALGENDELLCALWAYHTHHRWTLLEFPVTNPKLAKDITRPALRRLIASVSQHLISLGDPHIRIGIIGNERVARLAEETGHYTKTPDHFLAFRGEKA